MGLKDIYHRAMGSVIAGKMSKDDLWEIFEEHITDLKRGNKKLSDNLDNVTRKYEHLLEQVNNAHKEHKKLTDVM